MATAASISATRRLCSTSSSVVSHSVRIITFVLAISSSFSGTTALTAFTKAAFISSSVRWGVRHFLSFLNLWLHWKITLRYLSLECQTLEPYQFPHSEHLIFEENMLALLYPVPILFLRSISSCTSSHLSGGMIASWFPST